MTAAPKFMHKELDNASCHWCKASGNWKIVKENNDAIYARCGVCGQSKVVFR